MNELSEKFVVTTDTDVLDPYIARIADHDKDALAQLYHLTSGSVYGFALSMLKNTEDAEDVLQDTYLSIYASASGYRSMGKPLAWILRITRNLCLMKLRDRKKIAATPLEELNLSFDNAPLMTHEDRIVLKSCMQYLSKEEAQIVMLRAVSGFKHREIADFLALPLSTVLSKYHRAIKKIKILFNGEESK